MADFTTHITTSTVLGMAGGLAANAFYDVPPPNCVLAAGLCSVSGMLPDLDSDSGVPLRESVAFAAAVIPLMLIERFAKLGLSLEWMILAGGAIYLLVRFGFAEFLKRYTIHRGMFHSIPAMLIFGELTFLLYDNENIAYRYLAAGAVMTGYLSHLLLDEIWSIELNFGLVRFKKSFGSALKFWGDSAYGNLSTYAKLILLTLLMTKDPSWSRYVEPWMNGRHVEYAQENAAPTWNDHYLQNQYGGAPPQHASPQQGTMNLPQFTTLQTMPHEAALQNNPPAHIPYPNQTPVWPQPPIVPYPQTHNSASFGGPTANGLPQPFNNAGQQHAAQPAPLTLGWPAPNDPRTAAPFYSQPGFGSSPYSMPIHTPQLPAGSALPATTTKPPSNLTTGIDDFKFWPSLGSSTAQSLLEPAQPPGGSSNAAAADRDARRIEQRRDLPEMKPANLRNLDGSLR